MKKLSIGDLVCLPKSQQCRAPFGSTGVGKIKIIRLPVGEEVYAFGTQTKVVVVELGFVGTYGFIGCDEYVIYRIYDLQPMTKR